MYLSIWREESVAGAAGLARTSTMCRGFEAHIPPPRPPLQPIAPEMHPITNSPTPPPPNITDVRKYAKVSSALISKRFFLDDSVAVTGHLNISSELSLKKPQQLFPTVRGEGVTP